MNGIAQFQLLQSQHALASWISECERKMGVRFPKIDFYSNVWPLKTLYKTRQQNVYMDAVLASFITLDSSYGDVLRCLLAERVFNEKFTTHRDFIASFRLLSESGAYSFFEINLADLRKIESDCLNESRLNIKLSSRLTGSLTSLQKSIEQAGIKGVIPRISYRVSNQARKEFNALLNRNRREIKSKKGAILNSSIQAFNIAFNALSDNDERLLPLDRVTIATMAMLMCAPSRINEVLCMSVDDIIEFEDFTIAAQRTGTDQNLLNEVKSAHQMLITMKGSKGADWGPKPVLNFMIDVFKFAKEVIESHGQRSRMLVKYYKENPTKLFLPPDLEYLRGQNISIVELAKIISLSGKAKERHRIGKGLFRDLKSKQFQERRVNESGEMIGNSKTVITFSDLEQFLLEKVHKALDECRVVTVANYYEGDISNMLFLFDRDSSPFLPSSLKYNNLQTVLNGTAQKNRPAIPSLFEKLNITSPINGKVQVTKILTHDPRRWLTTMAQIHGEDLSDVLINKWARRLNLTSLKYYDFRTAEDLADNSKMPETIELSELSEGIDDIQKTEGRFGLSTAIVMAHTDSVKVTSMDKVLQAVEDRPIARTSGQVIVLYPSQYGVCLHQHHEAPCLNYDSCLPCDNNIIQKGHLPTNDSVRNRSYQLHKSIILQLERMVMEHNRTIVDDQNAFENQMINLVNKGFSSDQIADHLIDQFHEIKDLIQDKLFRKRLEEAFVAKGMAQRLNDDDIPSGTLIKYHNPTYNAFPGTERAIASYGGRGPIEIKRQELIKKYPEFVSKNIEFSDQRHLLVPDEEGE